MDASTLLIFHSAYRWVVLCAMLVQILWIYIGHRRKVAFNKKQFYILLGFTLIFDVQLLLGWLLYLESALVSSFWRDITVGIKSRQMRFFGLEHMSMMTLGILLINLYTALAYRKLGQTGVFTFLWKPYLIIYFIILSSVPWSFSPLTHRPNIR